jgi:hypothetical protein
MPADSSHGAVMLLASEVTIRCFLSLAPHLWWGHEVVWLSPLRGIDASKERAASILTRR